MKTERQTNNKCAYLRRRFKNIRYYYELLGRNHTMFGLGKKGGLIVGIIFFLLRQTLFSYFFLTAENKYLSLITGYTLKNEVSLYTPANEVWGGGGV